MEKIYMEENRNNSPKKRRSLLSSTSIMMSFVLAFVAIVSIASFGFSQVSYAIPEAGESPFPDSVVTLLDDDAHKVKGLGSASPIITLHRATVNGSEKYVYCIESDLEMTNNATYQKGEKITDKGLLFLLTYLASDNYQIIKSNGEEVSNPLAKGWIVQTALWVYLHETGYPNNTGSNGLITDAAVTAIRAETKLYSQNGVLNELLAEDDGIFANCALKNSGLSSTDATINGLIAKAKRIKNNNEEWNNFDFNLSRVSEKITLTDDGQYYQSDLITVNGTSSFVGYMINTAGLPTGTKIIGSDGNEITDVTNLPLGTQFMLKIPKNNITEENKNVTVSVTAAFTGKTAYYYRGAEGTQKIAFTGDVTERLNKGLVIPFNIDVPTEDTGITAAQSVYFIGLIILLAGVGIIYANIKPREVRE